MSTIDEVEGLVAADEPDEEELPERDDRRRRRTITVTVFAPVHPDPKRFRFRLSTTVGAAARIAAEEFGYDANSTPSFSTADGVILDRNLTLEAAGVKRRDELELVDVGGGV